LSTSDVHGHVGGSNRLVDADQGHIGLLFLDPVSVDFNPAHVLHGHLSAALLAEGGLATGGGASSVVGLSGVQAGSLDDGVVEEVHNLLSDNLHGSTSPWSV